jgi:hypothetical protein
VRHEDWRVERKALDHHREISQLLGAAVDCAIRFVGSSIAEEIESDHAAAYGREMRDELVIDVQIVASLGVTQ